MTEADLEEIGKKVRELKETAKEIKSLSDDFPAVRRNIHRIMASIKMLEINTIDMICNE